MCMLQQNKLVPQQKMAVKFFEDPQVIQTSSTNSNFQSEDEDWFEILPYVEDDELDKEDETDYTMFLQAMESIV